MQLYRLNDQYQLEDLIEDYDSLIWSERYRLAGDFELNTSAISKTIESLPLGSCVSLFDTKEVGIVETYEIKRNDDGQDILTVTGRTYETFFENRITLKNEDPIKNVDDGSTIAYTITFEPGAIATQTVLQNSATNLLDDNEVIPNYWTSYTSQSITNDQYTDRYVARGQTYDEAIKILSEVNLGIRTVRPNTSSSTVVVEIYSGNDVSDTVVFDVGAGHFDGAVKYLFSIRGFKTAVYVATDIYFVKVFREGYEDVSGLDHRLGLLDITDAVPAVADSATAMLTRRGKTYLAQNGSVNYIDGTVSPSIPYKYKVDYNLGDIILIQGEYGFSQKMQVLEYIRVQDKDGERGYPTLG